MQASKIISDVMRDLNDIDGVYWTPEQLHSYYREALAELAELDKTYFTKRCEVQLMPGNVWQSGCDCTKIFRVIGETDGHGQLLNNLIERVDDNIFLWPGSVQPACPVTATASSLEGYSINKNDDKYFKVYPPVVAGSSKYVLLECYDEPDYTDLTLELPERFVAPIKQWMLYRAMVVDAENNTAIAQIAKMHLDTYDRFITLFRSAIKEKENERNSHIRAVQNDTPKEVSS